MHFAASAAESALRFTRCAAIRAAARGVGEALLLMEFLLTGSEDEGLAAIAAAQCFVSVAHSMHSFDIRAVIGGDDLEGIKDVLHESENSRNEAKSDKPYRFCENFFSNAQHSRKDAGMQIDALHQFTNNMLSFFNVCHQSIIKS